MQAIHAALARHQQREAATASDTGRAQSHWNDALSQHAASQLDANGGTELWDADAAAAGEQLNDADAQAAQLLHLQVGACSLMAP